MKRYIIYFEWQSIIGSVSEFLPLLPITVGFDVYNESWIPIVNHIFNERSVQFENIHDYILSDCLNINLNQPQNILNETFNINFVSLEFRYRSPFEQQRKIFKQIGEHVVDTLKNQFAMTSDVSIDYTPLPVIDFDI